MTKKYTNIDEICALVEKSIGEQPVPANLPPEASLPPLDAQRRSGKVVAALMRYWMEEYNNTDDPAVVVQAFGIAVANGIFPFAMEFGDGFLGEYEQHGRNAIHIVTAMISRALHSNLAATMGEDLDHNVIKVDTGPTFANIHLRDVQ